MYLQSEALSHCTSIKGLKRQQQQKIENVAKLKTCYIKDISRISNHIIQIKNIKQSRQS